MNICITGVRISLGVRFHSPVNLPLIWREDSVSHKGETNENA